MLSVLAAEILIEYFFIQVAAPHFLANLMMKVVLLIILLLPGFYLFFYRPMTMQIEKLEKAEVIQRELSLIDSLTGLYNRRGFSTYANHLMKLAERTQKNLVLIYADLDNLKLINDQLGHKVGDEAIASIAKVLTETFRESDVVGRVGGDEFAALAFEVKEENITVLRERLDQKLKKSEGEFNQVCALTLSLGIISYNPKETQTIEDLLKQADALMYEAKRSRHKIAFDLKDKENG